MERKIVEEGRNITWEILQEKVIECVNNILKKTCIRGKDVVTQKIDPPWFNKGIERQIEIRRKYSRIIDSKETVKLKKLNSTMKISIKSKRGLWVNWSEMQ